MPSGWVVKELVLHHVCHPSILQNGQEELANKESRQWNEVGRGFWVILLMPLG